MGIIVKLILDALISLIRSIVTGITYFVVNEVVLSDRGSDTERFAPTLTYFKTLLRGDVTSSAGVDNWELILSTARWVAFGIIFILITVQAMSLIFGSAGDNKRSDIIGMIWKLFAALAAIYITPTLMESMFTGFGDTMFDGVVDRLDLMEGGGISEAVTSYMSNNFGNIASTATYLADIAAVGTIITIVKGLINIIVAIAEGWMVIKCSVEIIQHYVTCCTLLMFSPISGAFLIGDQDHQKVTVNYWKMFLTEMGLMIFNRIWISLGLFLMLYTGNNGLAGALTFIAFMRLGASLATIAQRLGLTTGNLGMSLATSVGLAANGVMRTLGSTAQMVGKGATHLGAATGNPGMARFGQAILGKSVGGQAISSVMNNDPAGYMRRVATSGEKAPSNCTAAIKRELGQLARDGGLTGNIALANHLDSLNAAGRREALDYLQSKSGLFDNAIKAANDNKLVMRLTDIEPHGGAQFDILKGATVDEKTGAVLGGQKVGTAQVHDNKVGGRCKRFTNAFGNEKYLEVAPDVKTNGTRQTIPFANNMVFNGMSLPELAGIDVKKAMPWAVDSDGKIKEGVDLSRYEAIMNPDGSYAIQHRKNNKDMFTGEHAFGTSLDPHKFAQAVQSGTGRQELDSPIFTPNEEGTMFNLKSKADEYDTAESKQIATVSAEDAEALGIHESMDLTDCMVGIDPSTGEQAIMKTAQEAGQEGMDASEKICDLPEGFVEQLEENGMGFDDNGHADVKNLAGYTFKENEDGSFGLYTPEPAEVGEDGYVDRGTYPMEMLEGRDMDTMDGTNTGVIITTSGDVKMIHTEPMDTEGGAYETVAAVNTKGEVSFAGSNWNEIADSTDRKMDSLDTNDRINTMTALSSMFAHKGETYKVAALNGESSTPLVANATGVLAESGLIPTGDFKYSLNDRCFTAQCENPITGEKGQYFFSFGLDSKQTAAEALGKSPVFYGSDSEWGTCYGGKINDKQYEKLMNAGGWAQLVMDDNTIQQSREESAANQRILNATMPRHVGEAWSDSHPNMPESARSSNTDTTSAGTGSSTAPASEVKIIETKVTTGQGSTSTTETRNSSTSTNNSGTNTNGRGSRQGNNTSGSSNGNRGGNNGGRNSNPNNRTFNPNNKNGKKKKK